MEKIQVKKLANKVIAHKKIVLTIIMTMVFAVLGVREYFASYRDTGIMEVKAENNSGSIGNIWNGRVVEQSFTTDEDFYGVALLMGTYGKIINIGEIQVTVTDVETGEIVVDDTRRMESMQDNTYVYFVSDELVEVDEEKEFVITITGKNIINESFSPALRCNIYNCIHY